MSAVELKQEAVAREIAGLARARSCGAGGAIGSSLRPPAAVQAVEGIDGDTVVTIYPPEPEEQLSEFKGWMAEFMHQDTGESFDLPGWGSFHETVCALVGFGVADIEFQELICN